MLTTDVFLWGYCMSKEGEGVFEIHVPCPEKDCNGMLIPTGVKDHTSYYKCIVCEKEFVHVNGDRYIKV